MTTELNRDQKQHLYQGLVMKIPGKVAIVTGGAAGIGRAHVEALLEKCAKVTVVDFNQELGKQLSADLAAKYGPNHVKFIHCDVTKSSEFEDVFKSTLRRFGRLDIVVNNVGTVDELNWERSLEINLNSAYRGTLLGLQYMGLDKGGKGGVVINMASIGGLAPAPQMPCYAAAKHAIVGFTRSFGSTEHFDITGVRVNCVCPWIVKTDLAIMMLNDGKMYQPEKWQLLYAVLGKKNMFIRPETVAEALIQLVEDDTRNGEALRVQQNSAIAYTDFIKFHPSRL